MIDTRCGWGSTGGVCVILRDGETENTLHANTRSMTHVMAVLIAAKWVRPSYVFSRQGHDTETFNDIHSFELVYRASSKCGTRTPTSPIFFYHIGKDVFNRPRWGSREFQSLLESGVEYERLNYCALGILCKKPNLALRAFAKDKGVGINQQPVVAPFGAKEPL